jgi:putative transposase
MPSRNAVKELLTEGVYHAYNRGVEKRPIFMDHHDYRRFKQLLRQCLDREPAVTLLAYCLMPNHYHLLIGQADATSLSRFMQRLSVGYTMYFNRRYQRVGSLFQGQYKAARIVEENQLMEVSRYIHLNPERAGLGWRQHQYSSVSNYAAVPTRAGAPKAGRGPRQSLVSTTPLLSLFDEPGDYQHFLGLGLSRGRGPTLSEPVA